MYSVMKVKSFRGREGMGYNATLVREGKIVAFVMDDAGGGPVMYEWVDAKVRPVQGKFRQYDDSIQMRSMTPMEAQWEAHVIDQPGYKGYMDKMSSMTPDVYLETLIMAAKADERIRRMFRGSHVVMIQGGKLATFKVRPGHSVMDVIKAVKPRYPDAIWLNEMPIEKAIALARPLLLPE